MTTIQFVPLPDLRRARDLAKRDIAGLELMADLCRINTLSAVKLAGSGHLGSSFSAMDIVVWLYFHEMNTLAKGMKDPDRDVYLSSKGHDVPGLYSVLTAAEVLPESQLRRLRRFGGLDGHPEVHIPGIEFNTGSLGMGISKGRGVAWAKRHARRGGRVFVLTGDGELQEGQNYEALQNAVQQQLHNLHVIVDHNKFQTDKAVSDIIDLGDLEAKFRAFGWHVQRCDGHDFNALDAAFRAFGKVTDRPKALIADTLKGKGVSFMEPDRSGRKGSVYKWHSGAPDDASFTAAQKELVHRATERARNLGLGELELASVEPESAPGLPGKREYVADAYGEALVKIAASHPEIVVLDGDLAADCRVRGFEATYPDRFIENGIAEQDMVSMAGGLARSGFLPVVNSFASFLTARANEQIYNNATERSKIIYACHYAGLIPAGPGKSHQSVRDISLLGALPNLIVVQPANAREAAEVVRYCVEKAEESSAIRLAIGPSPRAIELPDDYSFVAGRGTVLRDGADAVLFAYGPVMLHEALTASELLSERGFELAVINMPWLNRVDVDWFERCVRAYDAVYVLEDHSPVGGLADSLRRNLPASEWTTRALRTIAIAEYPACGTPVEVLQHHRLDGASIAERIASEAGKAFSADHLSVGYSAEAPQ
jgi:transketolase